MPQVAEEKLATFCDVFCDEGAFDAAESEQVLVAAKQLGLQAKIHTEEFAAIGGAQLAARIGAISADHLCKLDRDGIEAMQKAGVVGVLLPGTTFFLNLERYAPARAMIEQGMDVAVASDFNSRFERLSEFVVNRHDCLRTDATYADRSNDGDHFECSAGHWHGG